MAQGSGSLEATARAHARRKRDEMRYYVKGLSGEKGPYELEEIRESVRLGRLGRDTLLRPEDGTSTVVVQELVPRDGTEADPRAVYAPPDESPDSVRVDQGSFASGFLFGFFCGCIALIWTLSSNSVGSETGRGVRAGFIAGLVIGVVGQLLRVLMQ